jgi:hypothetical protein
MIPSKRWFPTNLPARALWFENFATQFAIVATSLGFTNADIEQVNDDNEVFQFLADIFNQIKAFEEAVRQYRVIITEEAVGATTPQFPANPNFVLPKTIATGIFERLDKLRTRIMAADNYTNETGALLDILSKQTESIASADAKPTIQVSAAQMNYLFSLVVSGRAEADSWEVWILRKGGTWTNAKTGVGKSVDVTITPTNAGEAEQIQVRVQLRKNNQNYGQPSDIVYVTVNP